MVRSGGELMEESSKPCYRHQSYIMPNPAGGGRAFIPSEGGRPSEQVVKSGFVPRAQRGIPGGAGGISGA